MKVLMARIEPFDIESVKAEVDEVVDKFDQYLNTYQPKSRGTSMYALLGPINQVFQKINVTKDIEELTGFGIRVHENKAYISPEAKNTLYEAITALINLLNKKNAEKNEVIPRVFKPKIMERIRYKLYYKRKSAFIEYLEKRRREFIGYLKSKYNNSIEELNKETKQAFSDWNEIKYPTKYQLTNYTEDMQKICNEFLEKKVEGELIEDVEVE
jgi:hypothetical protein